VRKWGRWRRSPTARIVRVTRRDDERLLRVDLREGNRFRGGARSLVIELHTNQWNAVLVDGDDRRIVSVLRTRDAGVRILRAGEVYHPPSPTAAWPPSPAAVTSCAPSGSTASRRSRRPSGGWRCCAPSPARLP
jgi:hypothetical protein